MGTDWPDMGAGVIPMKIQFLNLVFPEFTLNLGIALMWKYRTFMVALLFFSITICWAKEVKN